MAQQLPSAQLLSIQIGLPAVHGADSISDKSWQSGIFKAQVAGPVWLDELNLAGDGQDDLKNHGGIYRAVLAYSAEHYPVWRTALNKPDLSYGMFGENFTISGLDEESVCIGDVYTIGEAILQVAQPRIPCWKLARRQGVKDLPARVQARAWGGWYHRVLQTGYVQAGQSITLVERPHPQYPIQRVFRALTEQSDDPQLYPELAGLEALSSGWRKEFAYIAAQASE